MIYTPNRLAIARMSQELFREAGIAVGWQAPAGFGNIPEGAEVIGISHTLWFDSNDVAVKFFSYRFPVVGFACVMPSVDEVVLEQEVWPEPGAWYTTNPTLSPFVTLEPRDDDPQPDAIVEG